jgi:hypothetical protein
MSNRVFTLFTVHGTSPVSEAVFTLIMVFTHSDPVGTSVNAVNSVNTVSTMSGVNAAMPASFPLFGGPAHTRARRPVGWRGLDGRRIFVICDAHHSDGRRVAVFWAS